MGKQNYFFSGITDILILAILCEHDSYVYEIVKFIKEKSNGCLSISQNTVYAVTYKLVNEGKISEYSKLVGKKRTRIYYHIEDEGRAYYENSRAGGDRPLYNHFQKDSGSCVGRA